MSDDDIQGHVRSLLLRHLLETHRRLLAQWRKTMNLVGPGDLSEHYADSEQALGWLNPTGRWADLGTGAGFPGIVMAAMYPELQIDLVDSRSKRCAFLNRVLTESGTSPERVRVHCTRVEDLPASTWDGVVSRAFAPPPQALSHARRLLIPGGTAVLFLQEDREPPAMDDFHTFHVEHYRVNGKRRKAVGLQGKTR